MKLRLGIPLIFYIITVNYILKWIKKYHKKSIAIG